MSITRRLLSLCARAALVAGVGALILAGSTSPVSAQDNTQVSAISLTDIQSVMGAHRLEVRRCVTRDDLPIRVDIVVDFVIDIDGSVERTTLVESNAGNVEVDTCVLEVIGSMQFPEPTNGRTFAVRYPMIFVTGG